MLQATAQRLSSATCDKVGVPATEGKSQIVVDNAVGSFYVPQNVDGAVSFFRLSRRTGSPPPVDAGKESSCCCRPRE